MAELGLQRSRRTARTRFVLAGASVLAALCVLAAACAANPETSCAATAPMLTDSCGHSFWLQLENSGKWNDAELDQLRALTVEDFEVVDSSHLMVDPGTFAIR
jgi:hypothetical protein